MQPIAFCLLGLFCVIQITAQTTQCTDRQVCTTNAGCRTTTTCNSTCNVAAFVCNAPGTLDCTATPSTPHCDRAAGQCVECTSNDQCFAKNSSLPYCSGNNVCVACTQDSQCTTKSDCAATCGPTNVCVAGAGENCSAFTFGVCYRPRGSNQALCSGECTPTDNACEVLYGGRKNFCVNVNTTRYECRQCTADSDCRTVTDCLATCNLTGYCVPSNNIAANCTNSSINTKCGPNGCGTCATDDECKVLTGSPTAACGSVNGTSGCVQCGSAQDCDSNDRCGGNTNCLNGVCNYRNAVNCSATGQYCNANGVCAGCLSNANCNSSGTNPFCTNGVCSECANDGDCAIKRCGASCNGVGGGSQLRSCQGGTICQAGFSCSGGRCSQILFDGCPAPCDNASIPVCDAARARCVECTSDSQCVSKFGTCTSTCSNNVCVNGTVSVCNGTTPVCDPGNGCVECTQNIHCQNASRPFCDGASNTCRQCVQNANCIKDSSCGANTCDTTSGQCTTGATSCNCTNNTAAKYCSTIIGVGSICVECRLGVNQVDLGDCNSGFRCNNYRCVQCTTDANCQSTTNCNARCVLNKCTNPTPAVDCTAALNNPGATCVTNNGGIGTCIECTANADCSAVVGKNFCSNSRCVRCNADSQCRTDAKCDSVCFNNTCYDKQSPLSCTGGLKCDLNTGKCGSCFGDSSCGANKFCSNGACVDCTTDSQCKKDTSCNALCAVDVGKCYSPLNVTVDCTASQQVCSRVGTSSTYVCAECATDSTCFSKNASRPYCTAGVCSECRPATSQANGNTITDTYDCRSASNCNATCSKAAGSNVYTCSRNARVCPTGQFCNIAAATCVSCLVNTDCASGTCVSNRCVECAADSECETNSACGAKCVGGFCERANVFACATGSFCRSGACVDCLTSADCPNGQPCNNFGVCGLCSNSEQCRTDARCAGVSCIDNACVTNASLLTNCGTKKCNVATSTCVDCFADSDCGGSTPYCTAGKCVACRTDANCRTNSACNSVCGVNGNCVASSSPAVCTAPNVCDTGTGICSECTRDSDCDSNTQCGRKCGVDKRCGGTAFSCSAPTAFCAASLCRECATDANCGAQETCSTAYRCVPCGVPGARACPPPPPSTTTSASVVITALLGLLIVAVVMAF